MQTSVNGQPAEWTPEIWAKWIAAVEGLPGKLTNANYFTPIPYQDEWYRGDMKEGFTYVVNGRDVAQVCINGHPACIVAPNDPPKGRR